MEDKTPFNVTMRYRQVVQPAQFMPEEAEISAQFTVPENATPATVIESHMAMVKKQVRIALGLEAGTLTAATDPQKRGPGRPKKEDPKPEPAPEPEETKPEPAKVEEKAPASDDDFGDTAGEPAAKEITDADVQAACRNAVADGKGALVAADVKNMARLKYGTDKVVAIKQEERAKFIADLKNLVAEKTKK